MHGPIRYTFYQRAHREQEGPKERASSNLSFFPPIPKGCPFTILWEFVACQLPRRPSCRSQGTAASLSPRRASAPTGSSSGKPGAFAREQSLYRLGGVAVE